MTLKTVFGKACFVLTLWAFTASLFFSDISRADSRIYEFVDVKSPPLSDYDKTTNKATGVAIEIFNLIWTEMGKKSNIRLFPGKRVLMMAKNNEVDGIPFLRKTEDRKAYLDYSSEPIYDESIYLYVRKDSDFIYAGLDSLK